MSRWSTNQMRGNQSEESGLWGSVKVGWGVFKKTGAKWMHWAGKNIRHVHKKVLFWSFLFIELRIMQTQKLKKVKHCSSREAGCYHSCLFVLFVCVKPDLCIQCAILGGWVLLCATAICFKQCFAAFFPVIRIAWRQSNCTPVYSLLNLNPVQVSRINSRLSVV